MRAAQTFIDFGHLRELLGIDARFEIVTSTAHDVMGGVTLMLVQTDEYDSMHNGEPVFAQDLDDREPGDELLVRTLASLQPPQASEKPKDAWPFEFTDGADLRTAVFEALGAASMCWSATPVGIFESDRAAAIGAKLVDRITELQGAAS